MPKARQQAQGPRWGSYRWAVFVFWVFKMLKKLFGKGEPKEEPEKDPREEATRKFYELVGLYTMSFHGNEGNPEWFYDRIEQLERELGEETAKAACDYASRQESFYYRLMY